MPISVAGVSSNSSLACLRVWSIVDSGVRVRPGGVAVDGEQADAGVGAGGDEDQVGGVAVEHEHLRAGERVAVARLRGRRVVMPASSHLPDRLGERQRGDRLAGRRCPGGSSFLAASSPECSSVLAASTTVEKYGAHSSARPISSSTMPSSTKREALAAELLGDGEALQAELLGHLLPHRGVVALGRSPSAGAPRSRATWPRGTAARSCAALPAPRRRRSSRLASPGRLVLAYRRRERYRTDPSGRAAQAGQSRSRAAVAWTHASPAHYDDAQVEIHKLVVGPFENNVFVLRCKQTGDAVLLDAANEHELLLELCQRARRARGARDPRPLGPHPGRAGVRDAGYSVRRHRRGRRDAARPTTSCSTTTTVIEVGDLRLHTIHTPGPHAGSMCFLLEGSPVLFSGDTLFPGGPGNTKFEGGDFAHDHRVDRPPAVHAARRHARAARPRRRHHDRHRAPAPPGVGRPGLVSARPAAAARRARPSAADRLTTAVHTADLPADAAPGTATSRPTAWVEAPDELRSLGDDLGQPAITYKRRIGPWLLWRAGPATRADARYWAGHADDLARTLHVPAVPRRHRRGRRPERRRPTTGSGPGRRTSATTLTRGAIGAVTPYSRPTGR